MLWKKREFRNVKEVDLKCNCREEVLKNPVTLQSFSFSNSWNTTGSRWIVSSCEHIIVGKFIYFFYYNTSGGLFLHLCFRLKFIFCIAPTNQARWQLNLIVTLCVPTWSSPWISRDYTYSSNGSAEGEGQQDKSACNFYRPSSSFEFCRFPFCIFIFCIKQTGNDNDIHIHSVFCILNLCGENS